MRADNIDIAGLKFTDVFESDVAEHVAESLRAGRGGWIVTANADISRLCKQQPELNRLVSRADLIVADGMPLLWAARLQGTPLKERVCGSNLVWSLAERASNDGRSLFLLGGGHPDTAMRAADELTQRFPQLSIAGTHYPPFGFEDEPTEIDIIRRQIEETKPDIVYVALGFPKAERLIDLLRANHPNAWWIGVGISLSFIAGEVPRAPKWMQSAGLEWVHRLTKEPGRLAKRYLWHDMPFVLMLLTGAGLRRMRSPQP